MAIDYDGLVVVERRLIEGQCWMRQYGSTHPHRTHPHADQGPYLH